MDARKWEMRVLNNEGRKIAKGENPGRPGKRYFSKPTFSLLILKKDTKIPLVTQVRMFCFTLLFSFLFPPFLTLRSN
jgi:hypothetical protein